MIKVLYGATPDFLLYIKEKKEKPPIPKKKKKVKKQK